MLKETLARKNFRKDVLNIENEEYYLDLLKNTDMTLRYFTQKPLMAFFIGQVTIPKY